MQINVKHTINSVTTYDLFPKVNATDLKLIYFIKYVHGDLI